MIKPDAKYYARLFESLKDSPSSISKSKFVNSFNQQDEDGMKQLFEIVDTSNDEQLQFDEFCSFVYALDNADLSDKSSVLFYLADKDFDGKINLGELTQISTCADAQAGSCDFTHQLCYNEFLNFISNLK